MDCRRLFIDLFRFFSLSTTHFTHAQSVLKFTYFCYIFGTNYRANERASWHYLLLFRMQCIQWAYFHLATFLPHSFLFSLRTYSSLVLQFSVRLFVCWHIWSDFIFLNRKTCVTISYNFTKFAYLPSSLLLCVFSLHNREKLKKLQLVGVCMCFLFAFAHIVWKRQLFIQF